MIQAKRDRLNAKYDKVMAHIGVKKETESNADQKVLSSAGEKTFI